MCSHGRKQWKMLENFQKIWVSTSIWESPLNTKKLHFSSCSCVSLMCLSCVPWKKYFFDHFQGVFIVFDHVNAWVLWSKYTTVTSINSLLHPFIHWHFHSLHHSFNQSLLTVASPEWLWRRSLCNQFWKLPSLRFQHSEIVCCYISFPTSSFFRIRWTANGSDNRPRNPSVPLKCLPCSSCSHSPYHGTPCCSACIER